MKAVVDMEKYLIDTNVFIDHLRGNSEATEILKMENLVVSVVTVVELIQGAANKNQLMEIENLLSSYEIDWGSEKINYQAASLVNKYFLKHSLKFMDALVASIAIQSNYILVTNNLKHFRFIDNLDVVLPQKLH